MQTYTNLQTLVRTDCAICGDENPLSLDERREGVDIVACQNCGLVWNQAMRPPQAQLEFYREHNRASGTVHRAYLISMLTRAACALEFLQEELKPGMRHLDVGCAEGTLLALTRAHGVEVEGLELDINFSRFAREARHLTVHSTTLDEAPLLPESFDLVSLVHVAEHLFHPLQELGAANNLLRDQGLLYIEVPNLNQPLPQLRRFFRSKHNFYFTCNTLRALVSRTGFRPLRVNYSPRDSSIQLLAVKDGTEFARSEREEWRDDAAEIYQHVNQDRRRYYLMGYFVAQQIRKERLNRLNLQRYGQMLPELQTTR